MSWGAVFMDGGGGGGGGGERVDTIANVKVIFTVIALCIKAVG